MTWLEDQVESIKRDRAARVAQLRAILGEVQQIDAVLRKIAPDYDPGPMPGAPAAPAPATNDEAHAVRAPRPAPARPHVRGLRAGRTLAEWCSLLGREFGDGREFTATEASAVAGSTGATRLGIESMRQVLELLVRGGHVRRSGAKGQRVRYSIPGGPKDPLSGRSLADSQRAWDEQQRQQQQQQNGQQHRSVAPVPGTGGGALAGLPKEVRELLAPAVAEGWRVTTTGSGHRRLRHPVDRARTFIVSLTPSSSRALDNIKADMRRVGAPLP